uniref:SET domain-containing protein n=1 Tax=Panagrolaimus sp. PS1159 TaxID=55785 RepID=A0AC35F0H7_9BILA
MNDFIDIEQHIAKAEESRRLNQSTPVPRPHRDPDFEFRCWQSRKFDNKAMAFRTTILSSDSYSSKTSMDELKPIKLCNMKVPMVHKGRYLICQAIGKPSIVVGAEILVKDLNGDVEIIAMYNFYYNSSELDWLNPGTILIIKEPWLRYGSNNKIPTMRIDSPSDVIVVDCNDSKLLQKADAMQWFKPLSKDSEIWRQKANDCFKKEKYKDALMLYDRAIRCNPELPVLYLNKSLTYLRTGAFYMAYESARLALEKGGDREKALFRMGQAAYGMREWQKAANHFVEVMKEFPMNKLASEQFKHATVRLSEQRNGKFDFKSMLLESKKEKAAIDVSDYTGPIKIANIPGKGRGIIATEDIKEGTLLAVSKAFASGYSQDFPPILFAIDLIRKEGGNAAQMLQIVRVMQNLQNNPQRAAEVYDLYAGDMKQDEEIPFGIIDAARIQKISSYNRFSSKEWDAEKLELPNEDSHLFILPSYFNHSCLANANRTFYGDVMVIHATMDIKKGDEICLSYKSPMLNFTVRKEKFEKSWKFKCECQLCKIDAKDKNCSKRNQMVDEFEAYVKSTTDSVQVKIAKGETLLKKIRGTYVNRSEFKLKLIDVLGILSDMTYDNGNWIKTLECLEEIVTLLDNPLKYSCGIARRYVNIAHCYISLQNFSKAKEMIQKAMKFDFCVDIDHFKMLHPNIAQYLPFLSF